MKHAMIYKDFPSGYNTQKEKGFIKRIYFFSFLIKNLKNSKIVIEKGRRRRRNKNKAKSCYI